MKLKSRLPPFSLIHIRCRRMFRFRFCSLLPLSKFWYCDSFTRWQSRHTVWFQIPYLGSCPPWIDRKISLISLAKCLASLIRDPIFFQIYMGLLEFGFKLIIFFFRKSIRILFTDRVLPTIRSMDKILGKVSPSPYSPKNTVPYGELRLFRCPDSALHWLDLNGWDDTEFASRPSVEWRGIHQWGITCLIGVVILRTVTQRCG